MDHSLAGRAIGRPLGPTAPRRSGRAPRARDRRADAHPRGWRRPFSIVAGLARGSRSLVRRHRRLRAGLVAVVISLPVLAGGWLWLRDSPLVSVEHVQLSGVHGPEAGAIEAALVRTARHMSTLDVRPGALRAAVAPYRVVREVRATPSFPHGLHIHVVEQLPVAGLTVAGQQTAVAADGVVLGPALLSDALPTLGGGSNGSTIGPLTGQRVHGALLACLTVLGAAPDALARQFARVFMGPDGVTVAMRNGLLVYFGDATRPHAKWLSLARVLADPSSAGASYVDVRLPERPAAGIAGAVAAEANTAVVQAGSASNPNISGELAAGLVAALGGGSSSGASTPGAGASPPSPPTTPAEATSTVPSQAGSGASTETTPAPTSEASTTPTPGG